MSTSTAEWSTCSRPAPLEKGEVHLWIARLTCTTRTMKQFRDSLSEDERTRAGKFRKERARDEYAIGRGLLRRLLASYTGTDAAAIRLVYGEHGKPALADDPPALVFNLAHSGGRILFAFARKGSIGVDLEAIHPRPNLMEIAERFFAPEEVHQLKAFSEDDRVEAFFHGWARKEAYLKARGRGLAMRLNHFTVSMDPACTVCEVNSTSQPAGWSVYSLPGIEGYTAAVATDCRNPSFSYHEWVDET